MRKEKAPVRSKDYAPRIHGIGEEFREIWQNFRPDLTFGPVYRVSTSLGEELRITTLLVPGYYKEGDKAILVIAQDGNGEIAGDRFTLLSDDDPEIVLADGSLFTVVRHKGLVVPIELVHMDLLQREANIRRETGRKPVGHIANMNKSIREAEDPAEREQWLAVWGAGGKLGYEPFFENSSIWFKKILTPNNDRRYDVPLETIEEIVLVRAETEAGAKGVLESQIIAADPKRLRTVREKEFETLLAKMLQFT